MQDVEGIIPRICGIDVKRANAIRYEFYVFADADWVVVANIWRTAFPRIEYTLMNALVLLSDVTKKKW